MDKNDIERRLEAAEKQNLGLLDEIKNLKAKLVQMQDKPEIPDFPVFPRDEPYWAMDGDMFVCGGEASGAIDDDDFNIFHTEKYAQLFADKCREIAMLLHCKWYCDRNAKIDFYDSKTKWYLYKHHYANGNFGGWKVYTTTYEETATIYFSTEEAAQKAADWMNAHAKRGDSNDA